MKQLLNHMKERGITRVKLLVVDLNGHPKLMVIPSDYLEEAAAGIGIDGSSIPGFATVDDSDLIAKPDLESAVFSEREVTVFCDVEHGNGQPFEGDCRSILKKIAEKIEVYAKPELEFYFLQNGAPLDERGYMDPAQGMAIVDAAVSNAAVPVERIHHENGPGQYEIEPLMAPAVKACDHIILLKEMLKEKAAENSMIATFMPKPLPGKAGSGMHFHVVLEKNGRNLFQNSDAALHFIGGLLSHAKGIAAICNPTINSYKRLVPDFEAPVYISWGRGNRSALVRIPQGGKPRIEYRAPDPLCNPYLALAAILGAGLDGMKNKIEPPQEMRGMTNKSKCHLETLPASLAEAVEEMENDDLIREILGPYIIRMLIMLRREEIKQFNYHVSQWELEHYLT